MQEKCPYCHESLTVVEGCCGACKAPLPWIAPLTALHDEIKSREVNRGRATMVLIEEVVEALRGGKPISLAALKGFAFAWLFPRTMIVVGSLAAGTFLGLQTWILWNQSKLLEGQTAAARVEQDVRIEERIARNRLLSASLDRLRDALSELTRSMFQSCKFDCDLNVMEVVLEWSNVPNPMAPPPTGLEPKGVEGRRSIAAMLTNIQMGTSLFDSAKGSDSLRSGVAWADDLVRTASLQCVAEVESVSQFRAALGVLGQLAEALEANTIPSVRQVMVMGAMQKIPEIAPSSTGTSGGPTSSSTANTQEDARTPSSYDLRLFAEDLGVLATQLSVGARDLSKKCVNAIERDVRTLSALRRIDDRP